MNTSQGFIAAEDPAVAHPASPWLRRILVAAALIVIGAALGIVAFVVLGQHRIAGMLPIGLGFGADASFRQPMAIAVIGGLLTSTALSLLVVPVVFTYVRGFEDFVVRIFKCSPRAHRDAMTEHPTATVKAGGE